MQELYLLAAASLPVHVEISSEQPGTEKSCKVLLLKKKKLEEKYIDTLSETLDKLRTAKSNEERNEQLGLFTSLTESGIKIKQICSGSIIIVLELEGVSALLCFGALYNSGMFRNMLTHGFITEEYRASHDLSSVMLTVEVKKEDYLKCLETMRQGKLCNISFLAPCLFCLLYVHYHK